MFLPNSSTPPPLIVLVIAAMSMGMQHNSVLSIWLVGIWLAVHCYANASYLDASCLVQGGITMLLMAFAGFCTGRVQATYTHVEPEEGLDMSFSASL